MRNGISQIRLVQRVEVKFIDAIGLKGVVYSAPVGGQSDGRSPYHEASWLGLPEDAADNASNIHFYLPKNGRDDPEPDDPEPLSLNVSNETVIIEGDAAVGLSPITRVIETVLKREPSQRKPPVDPVLRVWGKM